MSLLKYHASVLEIYYVSTTSNTNPWDAPHHQKILFRYIFATIVQSKEATIFGVDIHLIYIFMVKFHLFQEFLPVYLPHEPITVE